jgi:hypothetical protein
MKLTSTEFARKLRIHCYAVAILFVATSVPSWAQKSDVGTLYADNTYTGGLTAVNLVTHAFSSVATGGSAEGLTCGPDNRVYVALSGIYFGPRQIVRFNRNLSGETVVLDFASSPPLMSSGGPGIPSHWILDAANTRSYTGPGDAAIRVESEQCRGNSFFRCE